jgi:hypothetical protein
MFRVDTKAAGQFRARSPTSPTSPTTIRRSPPSPLGSTRLAGGSAKTGTAGRGVPLGGHVSPPRLLTALSQTRRGTEGRNASPHEAIEIEVADHQQHQFRSRRHVDRSSPAGGGGTHQTPAVEDWIRSVQPPPGSSDPVALQGQQRRESPARLSSHMPAVDGAASYEAIDAQSPEATPLQRIDTLPPSVPLPSELSLPLAAHPAPEGPPMAEQQDRPRPAPSTNASESVIKPQSPDLETATAAAAEPRIVAYTVKSTERRSSRLEKTPVDGRDGELLTTPLGAQHAAAAKVDQSLVPQSVVNDIVFRQSLPELERMPKKTEGTESPCLAGAESPTAAAMQPSTTVAESVPQDITASKRRPEPWPPAHAALPQLPTKGINVQSPEASENDDMFLSAALRRAQQERLLSTKAGMAAEWLSGLNIDVSAAGGIGQTSLALQALPSRNPSVPVMTARVEAANSQRLESDAAVAKALRGNSGISSVPIERRTLMTVEAGIAPIIQCPADTIGDRVGEALVVDASGNTWLRLPRTASDSIVGGTVPRNCAALVAKTSSPSPPRRLIPPSVVNSSDRLASVIQASKGSGVVNSSTITRDHELRRDGRTAASLTLAPTSSRPLVSATARSTSPTGSTYHPAAPFPVFPRWMQDRVDAASAASALLTAGDASSAAAAHHIHRSSRRLLTPDPTSGVQIQTRMRTPSVQISDQHEQTRWESYGLPETSPRPAPAALNSPFSPEVAPQMLPQVELRQVQGKSEISSSLGHGSTATTSANSGPLTTMKPAHKVMGAMTDISKYSDELDESIRKLQQTLLTRNGFPSNVSPLSGAVPPAFMIMSPPPPPRAADRCPVDGLGQREAAAESPLSLFKQPLFRDPAARDVDIAWL